MVEKFKYTPPELEPKPFEVLQDYTPNFTSKNNLTSRDTTHRKVYLYIQQFACNGRVDDYINMPKYSGKLQDFKAYKRQVMSKVLNVDEYREWEDQFNSYTKQDFQRMIAKDVNEVAIMLASRYEYLDDLILDEDEFEDEDYFTYQGTSEYWLHASATTLSKALLPQHNEYSKWFYILQSMSNSELKRLYNPYIREIFLKPMYVHPVIGLPFDIIVDDSSISKKNRQLRALVKKRFATSIENQKKARDAGTIDKSEVRLFLSHLGYIDGEELQIAIEMYIFALKFTSLFRTYPLKVSSHECALYIGNGERQGIAARANVLEHNLADIELKLSTPIGQLSELERELLMRKRGQYTRYLMARKRLSDAQSVPAEQILLNPNAKNVTGPIYTLKSLENGMWNEPKEEIEERKLIVEFRNPEDLGMTPG